MGEPHNAAERLKGGLKKKAGEATGDEQLKSEGRADQTKADIKDVGEKVKGAAKKAKDAVQR